MNCSVGDLAVVVKAELIENIGTIVRVLGQGGMTMWSDFDDEVYVWMVESTHPERPLVYRYGWGEPVNQASGWVPDCYLRPIRSRPRELKVQDHFLEDHEISA